MSIKKLEVILIIIGIIITLILGYSQWKIVQNQNLILIKQIETQEKLAMKQLYSQKEEAEKERKSQEKQTINQIEIQTMNLVANHLSNLSENGDKGKKAEKIVMVAANFLANVYERRSLAKMAKELIAQRTNVNAEVVLRISEAAEPTPENTKKPTWFTVLGSFSGNNLEKANEASKEIFNTIRKYDESISVNVYKTKFSNHYAIVAGGEQLKSSADQLTKKARSLKWAKDAYSQLNREWEKITK